MNSLNFKRWLPILNVEQTFLNFKFFKIIIIGSKFPPVISAPRREFSTTTMPATFYAFEKMNYYQNRDQSFQR